MAGKTGRGAGGALFTKITFPVLECGVEKPVLSHRHDRWLYVNNRTNIVHKYFTKNKNQKKKDKISTTPTKLNYS